MFFKRFPTHVLILFFIILLRSFLLYWGLIYDHFLVPPGDDPASHIAIIEKIIDTHKYFAASSYPPGYHILMALISQIFHIDPIKLVTYSGPLLVILPVIGVYHLSKRFFGQTAALYAAGVMGLAGAAPINAYGDGTYPNLVGSFLAIMAIEYFVLSFRQNPYRNGVIGAIWAIMLAGVHHLSFILFAIIMAFFILIFSIPHIFRTKELPYFKQALFVIGVTAFFGGCIAYYFYGKELLLPFLSQLVSGHQISVFDSYLSTAAPIGRYPEIVGSLPWIGGILGLVLLFSPNRQIPWERRIMFLVWVSVIFGLSKTSWFGLPVRFARELVVPLAITAGYAMDFIIQECRVGIARIVSGGVFAGFILISTCMLFTGPFMLPQGFSPLVRFWPEDQEKIIVLQSLPDGTKIAGTPSSPYYPLFLKKQSYVITSSTEGFQYFFVGTKPRGNPDGIVYPYYSNFETIRKAILAYPKFKTVYKFRDGSELRQIIHK